MDIPAKVIIFCPALDLHNKQGTLMAVSSHGFYELHMEFSGRNHTVILPIAGTGLIFSEPNSEVAPGFEVERGEI
jgi:hypothetical protein